MKICSCWELQYNGRQICNGTKECEECSCDGNENKCNFYSEKRKEGQYMNTIEMYLQAQRDGKTYRNEDMRYNIREGFHDEDGRPWDGRAFEYVNEIFDLNEWELDEYEEMVKGETEERKQYINTAEMYLRAQKDGMCYKMVNDDSEECLQDFFYQKDEGLFDGYGDKCDPGIWNYLDDMMQEKWELRAMTKSEAEKEFKIKIID